MNCARCLKPRSTGYEVALRKPDAVKLLRVGIVGDHNKFQCPRCNAIFFFPKDASAEQTTFNRSLATV